MTASLSRASGTTAVQPCMFDGPTLRRGAWPFGALEPWSFDLIMADPPWRFELYSDKGEEKSPQAHYATMTLDELAALPVSDLARDDCLLWLWATAPMLPQQIALGERWGFRYVTSGTWVKRTVHDKVAFGTGYVLRNAHEPFLILKRGDPKTARDVRSVIEARVREHSRKPDAAFRAAEKLMPWVLSEGGQKRDVRRLELFSRESRKGWETWGNETGKFDTLDGASDAHTHPRRERESEQ
jgi:N6-adenosine-specific RNA methylase IME4